MSTTFFMLDFSLWYYTGALRGIFSIFLNFLWFVVHFFSMPLLVRTLFAPWKRMTDSYQYGGIEAFLETFVMNIMTRILGAVVRLAMLIIGLILLTLVSVAFFVVIGFWICFPVVLVYAVLLGMTLFV